MLATESKAHQFYFAYLYQLKSSQVILPNGPRITKFNEPKKKKLAGLAKHKIWKVVLAQSLSKNTNVYLEDSS